MLHLVVSKDVDTKSLCAELSDIELRQVASTGVLRSGWRDVRLSSQIAKTGDSVEAARRAVRLGEYWNAVCFLNDARKAIREAERIISSLDPTALAG